MGSRAVSDLEAKLFEETKRGCMAVLVGPRKLGEIDYELYQDGNALMKIGLRGARLPEGTRSVAVLINDEVVGELEVDDGRGFLRLESARGDTVPAVGLKDSAAMRAGQTTVCSGTFHKD